MMLLESSPDSYFSYIIHKTWTCKYIEFGESFRIWGKCGDGHVYPTLPKKQNPFFYIETYLGRQPFKLQLQPQI